MSGRGLKAIGLAGLAMLVVAVPAQAGSFAADFITADTKGPFIGGGGATDNEFRLVAGNRSPFINSDSEPGVQHNVVAVDDGPDGEPLFSTPLIDPGEADIVAGTQYLTPGIYSFQCSLHQIFNMTGTLKVAGDGALPRPEVDVAIKARKLRNLREGKLFVPLTPVTQSDDVAISARVGGKPGGTASNIDLAAGENRLITLRLSRQAKRVVKKALKKGDKVEVEVDLTVPFGAPDSVTKKLK